jgi:two-component system LytT family response regulator
VRIRTVIVDDEPLARERLRTLLAAEPDVEIVAECANGRRAVTVLGEQDADLVFLDVQMPELDGFEVLESLGPERCPKIVFVTAYDRHALRAFEVHALDYLLKPFDRERFRTALDRARRELARSNGDGGVERRLEALLDELRGGRAHLERLVVRSVGRVTFLPVDEIDWIEGAGNYARVHTGARDHLVRETMKTLSERLDPRRFTRIHRSTIVNVERIRELRPGFHGEFVVILTDGTRLASSRNFSDRLRELMRP